MASFSDRMAASRVKIPISYVPFNDCSFVKKQRGTLHRSREAPAGGWSYRSESHEPVRAAHWYPLEA
jgi:hypothetical protein